MKKAVILKVLAYTLLAVIAFTIISIIIIIVLPTYSFELDGLLTMIAIIAAPLIIATLFLCIATDDANKKKRICRKSLLLFFFTYCLLLIIALFLVNRHIGMPFMEQSFKEMFRYRTNFIPFKTIIGYIDAYKMNTINTSVIKTNLLGNTVLFLPMGLFLPYIFRSLRKIGKFILIMIFILCFVELSQVLLNAGSCDIDDVILNLVGATVGFLVFNISQVKELFGKMYIISD